MIVEYSTKDRWGLHKFLMETLCEPNSERDFQFVVCDDHSVIVRKNDEKIEIPAEGRNVRLIVEYAPRRRKRGKNIPFVFTQENLDKWLDNKMGGCIDIKECYHSTHRSLINKNTARYTMPFVRSRIIGELTNIEEFERILRNGIGDAKAYGFGMVICLT